MARGPEGAADAVRGAEGEPAAPLEAAAAAAGRSRSATQQDDDVVTRDAHLIGHQAVEVEHQARAAGGFGGEDRIHSTGAHVDAA